MSPAALTSTWRRAVGVRRPVRARVGVLSNAADLCDSLPQVQERGGSRSRARGRLVLVQRRRLEGRSERSRNRAGSESARTVELGHSEHHASRTHSRLTHPAMEPHRRLRGFALGTLVAPGGSAHVAAHRRPTACGSVPRPGPGARAAKRPLRRAEGAPWVDRRLRRRFYTRARSLARLVGSLDVTLEVLGVEVDRPEIAVREAFGLVEEVRRGGIPAVAALPHRPGAQLRPELHD
jgi:hypothetical protein